MSSPPAATRYRDSLSAVPQCGNSEHARFANREMVSPSTMLTSAKEPTPASAMRTTDVMWAKWESREHAHTRETGLAVKEIMSTLLVKYKGTVVVPPLSKSFSEFFYYYQVINSSLSLQKKTKNFTVR
jgi:hypothetical protein